MVSDCPSVNLTLTPAGKSINMGSQVKKVITVIEVLRKHEGVGVIGDVLSCNGNLLVLMCKCLYEGKNVMGKSLSHFNVGI